MQPSRSRLSSGDLDFDAEWAEDDLQVTHISSNLIEEAALDIEADPVDGLFDGQTLWEPPKFSGLDNSTAGGFVDLTPPGPPRPGTPVGGFVNLVPMWDDWGDLFAEAEALRPTKEAMRQAAEELVALEWGSPVWELEPATLEAEGEQLAHKVEELLRADAEYKEFLEVRKQQANAALRLCVHLKRWLSRAESRRAVMRMRRLEEPCPLDPRAMARSRYAFAGEMRRRGLTKIQERLTSESRANALEDYWESGRLKLRQVIDAFVVDCKQCLASGRPRHRTKTVVARVAYSSLSKLGPCVEDPAYGSETRTVSPEEFDLFAMSMTSLARHELSKVNLAPLQVTVEWVPFGSLPQRAKADILHMADDPSCRGGTVVAQAEYHPLNPTDSVRRATRAAAGRGRSARATTRQTNDGRWPLEGGIRVVA